MLKRQGKPAVRKRASITENYYCTDNFFKKMTDLESPRKNNDCYFYYYSKCSKGDECTFRHEPSALGCETMCSFWKEGKCLNVHCNFRHMELRKNRKAIACYWEAQPGGCLKQHCPFMHQTPKAAGEDEPHKTDSGTESADNSLNLNEKSFKNTPVDSLVVNFEEESDNDSISANSPDKLIHRPVKVKTLEEIKLDRIQAESAAYYSYPEVPDQKADDLRQRIVERFSKKRPVDTKPQTEPTAKRSRKSLDLNAIKIKTLDEIRAERLKKLAGETKDISDNMVSSSEDIIPVQKPTRIKLQRRPMFEQMARAEEKEGREEEIPKTLEEVLLLQDDDDASNVSFKDEDKLLNAFDEFLEN